MNAHQRRVARRAELRFRDEFAPLFNRADRFGNVAPPPLRYPVRTPGKSRVTIIDSLTALHDKAKKARLLCCDEICGEVVGARANILGAVSWTFKGKRIAYDALVAELVAK